MPCYDPQDDPIAERRYKELFLLRASLCGILSVLENDDIFDKIDYEKAGISKDELLAWWEKHKSDDLKKT